MERTKTKKSSSASRKTTQNNGKSSQSSSASSSQQGSRKQSTQQKSTQQNKSGGANESSMLEELFIDSLKDIYWAEKHLTKALPKMQKAATAQELKDLIEEHVAVTEEHITRLEQVFELMGKKAQAKKCEAMEGLTKEAESIVEETQKQTMTRDAGIIMAAQKVEHYEIATYGSLVALANTMGHGDIAEILEQTLNEEKEADENLTQVAESSINIQANEEEEGEEEEEEDK